MSAGVRDTGNHKALEVCGTPWSWVQREENGKGKRQRDKEMEWWRDGKMGR